MGESFLVEEFEKLRTAKRKGAEQDDVGRSGGSASGTRRTRSSAAPEWSAQDSLILVYEISAVEGECADALSTYQKWIMIAENCAALDVARTSHQCRRKWDSLLTEYKMIVEWQKRKKGGSYWSLDCARRKKAGLPLDFTEDLFKAIDEVVKVQGERSETDPDTDTEAEFDADVSNESGSKKLRCQSTHHKEILEEEDDESTEMELPQPLTPCKGITMEGEQHLSVENESRRRSARCKGINKGKEHVPVENQLLFHSTCYQEFSKVEHLSSDDESEHERIPHRETTEEIKHTVSENEPRSQSTYYFGTDEKEHAFTENDSLFKLAPCINEHVPVEYDSQKVSSPLKRNYEEKERLPMENKSCYQLSPVKVIMEGEERAVLQLEPVCQTTPTERALENGSNTEEKKRLLAAKVRENTRLMHAIIAGNSGQKTCRAPSDMKYEEASEIKRARQNADKLIACIADLTKNLDLLNRVIEEGQGKSVLSV